MIYAKIKYTKSNPFFIVFSQLIPLFINLLQVFYAWVLGGRQEIAYYYITYGNNVH